jgi:hypothetical protein
MPDGIVNFIVTCSLIPSIRWLTPFGADTDYCLFSFSGAFSSRLFGDFSATACLIILDPEEFIARVVRAFTKERPGWSFRFGPVSYYDPIRVDPSGIVVTMFKPFKHAYQQEVRGIWTPSSPVPNLEPFEIDLGTLRDCAILVDIESHPPVELPDDPHDALVITFGKVNKERLMVNKLPGVAKMQGLILYRDTPQVEQWHFDIQYTDAAGTWHEIRIPVLDGLYLLNMLRTAEKEQHLGIWNRE